MTSLWTFYTHHPLTANLILAAIGLAVIGMGFPTEMPNV